MATTRAGIDWFTAEVHKGTKRDAILYSVETNHAHELPRTNADKRHAVTLLLNDAEWNAWADREIARQCVVHHSFVSKMRLSLSPSDSEPTTQTYTTRNKE